MVLTEKQKQSVDYFNGGFNCAQSVLAVFCERYGLDRITALKIASGLGAGFRSGEICGAAAGAALVIGLNCGQAKAEDTDAKSNCNARTKDLLDRFQEENGSIVCRALLNLDLSIPEEYAQAKEKNLFQTKCVDFVKSAVLLLEEAGY